MKTCILPLLLLVILFVIWLWNQESSKESYQDPIWSDQSNYWYDYWPHANGQLGSHLFAGYPIARNAY